MATPLVLYPGVFDKTNVPRILTLWARYPQDPSSIPHTVPSLNFAWLSRGVSLLGASGTGLLCPPTLWGSIKQIFPEYWTPVVYRCWGHPAQSPMPIYSLGLDKTNFPRILNPRRAKGETIPTTRTRSRIWTLTSGWATRGTELRLTTWRPPSSCTLSFSIKRIFPEYWPARPGTHRTLLQHPHDPVPEFCLALPWCTVAGGSRHMSSVPIHPLGLDKTNLPRILNLRATISTTFTRSRTWTLTSGWLPGGQNYV